MKIVPGTIGIFWTREGWNKVFHADFGLLPGETVAEALARYRKTFPEDVLIGAKDKTGRWIG